MEFNSAFKGLNSDLSTTDLRNRRVLAINSANLESRQELEHEQRNSYSLKHYFTSEQSPEGTNESGISQIFVTQN